MALSASLLVAVVPAHADDGPFDIQVQLSDVDADRDGRVECALFASGDGFPMDDTGVVATVDATGYGSELRCEFSVAMTGDYAVAVMHDENGNGEVDRNLVGRPTEGWGTSQNVAPAFRAPRFSESRFAVADATTIVRIRMRY